MPAQSFSFGIAGGNLMFQSLSHLFVSCLAGLLVESVSHDVDSREISKALEEPTNQSADQGLFWLFLQPQYRLHITVWVLCGIVMYKTYQKKKLSKGNADGKADEKEAKKEKTKKGIKKEVPQKEESTTVVPASELPQFKLSQILPLFAMVALQKFDIVEMGYVRHVEVLYLVSQLTCCCILGILYMRIGAMQDSGEKILIPEVKVMGKVATPATKQSPKTYDQQQWKEQARKIVLGLVIGGGIYYKWATLVPIVMQSMLSPMQLYESPLFRIHILGKHVSRPFPVENQFGSLFSAPEDSKKVK